MTKHPDVSEGAPISVHGAVTVRVAPLKIPTFELQPADRNPMFLEKRVFQGSSGRVYPLPFVDRIRADSVEREWNAVHIENDYLHVVVLPQLGGRIYAAVDKINGYDFIYRNRVIKPALVGLAGPWISGGIEFNWPQHHRPSTYMPVDVSIEEEADGSRTVWLSEHEPMNRMKGMHGIRLRPDKACLELRVRLYNRTDLVQTFMWWANVATDVHERYQSFFPEDVRHVADHAKRAMSTFPLCSGRYYGVDYGTRGKTGVPPSERPANFVATGDCPANDLRWYANIPVPTSYMCVGSEGDFFGGYDHAVDAGLVYVADHHIAPGKKQWTWGNHDFGYAWDRNLTEPDEAGVYHPYFELMAGVYTDNQPDFSFLAPGETKSFQQYWYPIRKIGPVSAATTEFAASLTLDGETAIVGVHALGIDRNAMVRLDRAEHRLAEWRWNADPATPLLERVTVPSGTLRSDLRLTVLNGDGQALLVFQAATATGSEAVPEPATEPPAPSDIESVEELFLTGQHLVQYHHATRQPEAYWLEALKRDPLDSRCNNAMGLHHLRRAEFDLAESCFRKALQRLNLRNSNPSDGEPSYNLGVTLRHMGRPDEAYAAFFKATWNAAWRAAGYHALAEIDAVRGRWREALQHVEDGLRYNADNLRARDLKAICLRHVNVPDAADALLTATLALDPLDFWAQDLLGRPLACDTEVILDLALDYARIGDVARAYQLLAEQTAPTSAGTEPLVHYYAASFAKALGREAAARRHRLAAKTVSSDYCFPNRLEDVAVLKEAMDADPLDATARYYLGNLFYDRRRHREAIDLWQQSAAIDPTFSIVWRNLGIGYFNFLCDPDRSIDAYDRAYRCTPNDARVFYERDQLWKRVGRPLDKRLAELEARGDLVASRDDLCVELSALLNQVGRPRDALAVLLGRQFQPWEGGEGLALEQYVETRLALGRAALRGRNAADARDEFAAALTPPTSLGEARHLLANQSDVHYWLGVASAALGDAAAAEGWWRRAADFTGDFLGMEVRPISEKTYYSALAKRKLGLEGDCRALLAEMKAFAEDLLHQTATIDYFATSLPTMLIFEDDLQKRQELSSTIILAQVHYGMGAVDQAKALLDDVLDRDPTLTNARVLVEEISTENKTG
jgi:tetratricopeptide (TPR) repeat protein